MRTPQPRPNTRLPGHAAQRGFVLVIALILMATIGITSTAGIRMAMDSDALGQGLRSTSQAQQAAEAGLRWCELQVRKADLGDATAQIAIRGTYGGDGTLPTLWSSLGTFTNNETQVPAAVLAAAGQTNFTMLPRCVAEYDNTVLPTADANGEMLDSRAITVTIRAFSPDFRRQANNDTAGSEVWLQSTLVLSY
jgi:hypothetical protein